MGNALGPILPLAVGVAISPLPIMAVILILFTPNARRNGVAFAAGWVVGLAAVSAIVLLVVQPQDTSSGGSSTFTAMLHLVLGFGLLALAGRRWRNRPGPGELPTPPRWMAGLNDLSAAKALGLGAMLSGANPKNTILTLSAAVSVAQAEVSTGVAIAVVAIYIVIASVTVAGPVGLLLLMPERAERVLGTWRTGLAQHGSAIGVTLFLVFGALLVGKGIVGLS